MKPPKDKSPTRPGGRAADRLRDFLEKRLSPEEAEAELQKRTNIKPEERKESDRRETDSRETDSKDERKGNQ
jgi:hypothetical protein